MTVLPDICFSSSLSFIWYFPIPFVAKSFWNVTLRDWEVYWPPQTEVPRWLLSSDTVKFYIGIFYLFLGYSFHLFLYWSSWDTLLSSDWVLGHRPSPFQCRLYLWDQLAPTNSFYIIFCNFSKIQFSRISIDRVWFSISRKFLGFWSLLLPNSIGIWSILDRSKLKNFQFLSFWPNFFSCIIYVKDSHALHYFLYPSCSFAIISLIVFKPNMHTLC